MTNEERALLVQLAKHELRRHPLLNRMVEYVGFMSKEPVTTGMEELRIVTKDSFTTAIYFDRRGTTSALGQHNSETIVRGIAEMEITYANYGANQ